MHTIVKIESMALEIVNYKKSFSEKVILEVPSLSLKHGIYWIKGDNGSGKSTFFKSIGGLIPFDGDIHLNEFSSKKDQQQYRKFVSYSEAEPTYPSFLSQKDLITFYAKTINAEKEQIDTLISQFDTLSYYHNSVSTYSSGMLKKTGLLLSFIGSPRLIILDEPFITIDKKSTERLEQLILSYYDSGVTFLISSHMREGKGQLPIKETYLISNQQLIKE